MSSNKPALSTDQFHVEFAQAYYAEITNREAIERRQAQYAHAVKMGLLLWVEDGEVV